MSVKGSWIMRENSMSFDTWVSTAVELSCYWSNRTLMNKKQDFKIKPDLKKKLYLGYSNICLLFNLFHKALYSSDLTIHFTKIKIIYKKVLNPNTLPWQLVYTVHLLWTSLVWFLNNIRHTLSLLQLDMHVYNSWSSLLATLTKYANCCLPFSSPTNECTDR